MCVYVSVGGGGGGAGVDSNLLSLFLLLPYLYRCDIDMVFFCYFDRTSGNEKIFESYKCDSISVRVFLRGRI